MPDWSLRWTCLGLIASAPSAAAAADLTWTDSRVALPVFLVGAALMSLIGWMFARKLRNLGLVLWLLVVTGVGSHAVFAQGGAFKAPWQLAGFVLGAAVFVLMAERALQRVRAPE